MGGPDSVLDIEPDVIGQRHALEQLADGWDEWSDIHLDRDTNKNITCRRALPVGNTTMEHKQLWLRIAAFSALAGLVGFFILPAMTVSMSVIGSVASLISMTRFGGGRVISGILCLAVSVFSFFSVKLLTAPESLMTARISGARLVDARDLRTIGQSLLSFREEHGRWPSDFGDLSESGHLENAAFLVEEDQRIVLSRYAYLGGGEEPLPRVFDKELLAYTESGRIDCPGLLNRRFWKTSWAFRRVRNDEFTLLLFADGGIGNCYHLERLLEKPAANR